jgi:hypothetical protein
MIPKPEAGIVYGKVYTWVSKDEYLQMKATYYDEDGVLVKTMIADKVKKMDGRIVPTYMEMIPEDKPGEKTIIEYQKIDFNVKLSKSFFSEQNMKRVR